MVTQLTVLIAVVCASLVAGQVPDTAYSTAIPDAMVFEEAQAPAPGPEAPPLRNGSCAFVFNGARYYQVQVDATLQGARDSVFVNDALIRLLRGQLQVAPCQLTMSEGEACTSGTQALPCADPVFQCSNGLVISEDVYTAVLSGACTNSTANNTLVCGAVAANPAISAAVASGSCKPSCVSGTAGLQTPQNLPPACISYSITIDAPTRAAADALAAAIAGPDLQTGVTAALGGFSATGLQFLIVDSQVGPAVGFGTFPPPPNPPPPLVPLSPPDSAVLAKNSTAADLAAAGVLAYGAWTECSPTCGPGYRTRTASCYAPDGTLLPLLQCPGGAGAQTFEACS